MRSGGNVEATRFGGLFAVHRLLTRMGLVKAFDACLDLLAVHLPYFESDHVLNLAYTVLTGGTRLEDIDRHRNDVPLMNGLGARLLPDPTTAGDFLRRFRACDVMALMEAINSVRAQLWRSRCRDLFGEVVYLDVDGTMVPTTGERKDGMGISYKGIWGQPAPLGDAAWAKQRLGRACLDPRRAVPAHPDGIPTPEIDKLGKRRTNVWEPSHEMAVPPDG